MNSEKIASVEKQEAEADTKVDLGAVDPEGSTTIKTAVAKDVNMVLEEDERINLDIDWGALDKEALLKSLESFDNAENVYPAVQDGKHPVYTIYTCELPNGSGHKLQLEVSKVISPNYHELQIGIFRPDVPKDNSKYRYVAGFDFLQLRDGRVEEWDMKHRETGKPYRKQGIAGAVIDLMEEALKDRSEKNGLSQSISAKSGQKDLTQWLSKEGREFKPDGPENIVKLARLKSGDENLRNFTAKPPSYAAGETYVFDVTDFRRKFPELSGPDDPVVWDDNNYGKPFFYMESCFKIKLKKVVT